MCSVIRVERHGAVRAPACGAHREQAQRTAVEPSRYAVTFVFCRRCRVFAERGSFVTDPLESAGALSPARTRLLREYEANQRRAGDLVLKSKLAQLNWRNQKAWSVAECLAHLAQCNTLVGRAITAAMAACLSGKRQRVTGFRTPRWLGRWLVRLVEPPPRLKFKTTQLLQPHSREWNQDILAIYVGSHNHLLAAIRTGSEMDLEPVQFRHPAVPLRLTVMTGLRLMAAHDRRHLWQAEQLTQLPHFPR